MKWLDLAKEDLGLKEISGAKHNAKILSFYADAGHPEIKDDETAWCAAFLGSCLKRSGLPNSGSLAARSYLKYGSILDAPKEGCIAILYRGDPKGWQGHVGFYVGETETRIKLLGGNQGNAVSIASFPKSQVLGYRWPVEPTVKALKQAGSTEVVMADAVKKVGEVTVVGGGALKAADETGLIDQMKGLSSDVGVVKNLLDGLQGVFKLVAGNLGLATLVLAVIAVFVGHWWLKKRLQRHVQGHPLSSEG